MRFAVIALVACWACSSGSGNRFDGVWKNLLSSDLVTISRDGEKYLLRGGPESVLTFELNGGSLKGATPAGNVDMMQSSGNITWRGSEWQRLLPAPSDAIQTASGLTTKVIQAGSGHVHPALDDLATFDYTAWSVVGTGFTLRDVGRPETAKVSTQVAGLSEGLRLMVVGEVRRLWIPGKLGYENVLGGIPGMIVIDVRLIDLPGK